MRINYSALVNGLWEMTLLNKMGEVRRFDRVCLNLESDIDSILLRLPAGYGGIYRGFGVCRRQSQVLSLIGSTHFWTDWNGRRAREWEKWGFRTPQGESK